MLEWIVTDDSYSTVWRRVLEFANEDLCVARIEAKHALPPGSDRRNVLKQARQIRAALLQAKEYMEAARTSSTITSPNHLYYSAVSLLTSAMLVNGDGTKALDYLRRDPANRHHGLRFTIGNTSPKANLLNECHVEVLDRGFFRCWYETLPRRAVEYGLHTIHLGKAARRTLSIVGEEIRPAFSLLRGRKLPLADLFRFLPDCYDDLQRYGLAPVGTRVSVELIEQSQKNKIRQTTLHGCRNDRALELLLTEFKINADCHDCLTCELVDDRSAIVSFRIPLSPQRRCSATFPSIRTAMDGAEYTYAGDINGDELLDSYRIAFGLSMLSRYYPDLWVEFVHSHSSPVKLVERFVALQATKLPMLVLRYLSGNHVVVSTHQPPWT